MKKIVIFGAGNLGRVLANELGSNNTIVGFLDNDSSKWGKEIDGYTVLGNDKILNNIDYDQIVIASTMRYDEIKSGLVSQGVEESRFNKEIQNRYIVEIQSRINFLRDYSKICGDDDCEYAVAEGGVFQGMFAAEINKYFPTRQLYLFDTFSGFDLRDIEVENKNHYSESIVNYYSETSEDIVLSKMMHPEKVIIKKGYFPQTTIGLENTKYIFVNLDFDLYNPIYEGLSFFYGRMKKGGIILIHDYFTEFYHGVRNAVKDFEVNNNIELRTMPIGDGISIAIIC